MYRSKSANSGTKKGKVKYSKYITLIIATAFVGKRHLGQVKSSPRKFNFMISQSSKLRIVEIEIEE